MTPEQINLKLAEWAGWKPVVNSYYAAEQAGDPTPFWSRSKHAVICWLLERQAQGLFAGYYVRPDVRQLVHQWR